jgi:hypothetical protein
MVISDFGFYTGGGNFLGCAGPFPGITETYPGNQGNNCEKNTLESPAIFHKLFSIFPSQTARGGPGSRSLSRF